MVGILSWIQHVMNRHPLLAPIASAGIGLFGYIDYMKGSYHASETLSPSKESNERDGHSIVFGEPLIKHFMDFS